MNPYQPVGPSRPRMTSRHRAVAAIVFSFIGLVVVIGVAGALLGKPKTASHRPHSQPVALTQNSLHHGKHPAKASHPAPATGEGTTVHDGDFAFTVQRLTCGSSAAAAVSAGGIGEKVPVGAVECIVTMKVTDDKGSAQTFFDSDQYAYDARGRQFSADTNGSIYLHGDQDATQVNPGITITALVPFQIPRGDRITRLVLHDSTFSGGVTVTA